MSLQTLIDKSIKAMGSGMNTVVKEAAIELIKRSYKEGIYIKITHGYRSNEEQAKLYGQGRSSYVYNGSQYGNKKLNVVTNAKPGTSYHNFGLAIDYVLTNEDGTSVSWDVNSKWKRVAAIGKSLGFAWGGDWSSFKDYPHLEMTGGMSTSALRSGNRPNLKRKYTPIDMPTESVKAPEKPKSTPKEEVKKVVEEKRVASARFTPDVEWVKKVGISDGSNPAEDATREQVFNMMHRLYNLIMENFPNPDGSASPRFKDAIEWAKENEITDGSKPQTYASREQVVQMLYKYDSKQDEQPKSE